MQQLVVQDFQLAHLAVRAVKHDGVVACGDRGLDVFRQRRQVTDAVLHLAQQRGRFIFVRLVEQVDAGQAESLPALLGIVKDVELADEIATLAAPGRQQGMGVDMHVFKGQAGEVPALAKRLTPALRAQQFAPLHDVAPVKAAGIGNGQHDLAVRRQRPQDLHGRPGNLADAEDDHPLSDFVRQGLARCQSRENALVQFGTGGLLLLLAQRLDHRPPQPGLPALLRRQLGH